ncbi:MAG: hypothetical protein ACYTE3_18570 [Planctomycetota bacterium]|jgi:hypothetical protein
MSINEANSSCATIRGAMAAAIVTVAVLAVGALKAEQVSGRESNGLGRSRNSRPVSGPKSAYVPGEVIVKLRDEPEVSDFSRWPGRARIKALYCA